MLSINGNLLRNLILAVMASVCVIFCNANATAQNGEENGKKNGKENGKEEGEEKDEKEEGWTFKAKLNRAMLFWNDGGRHSNGIVNSRRRGSYFIDNEQDNSGVEAEGKFNLGQGWTAGIKFGLDAKFASSNLVSQIDRRQNMEMKLNDANLEVGHEKWGKLRLGYGDSASDGTSNINLAGSNVLADAEINNWNDSFFLRAGGALTPLRWGDFFAGPHVGETGRFITYVFPKVMGFELAASVGQPMDIFFVIPPVASFPGEPPVMKPPLLQERRHGLFTDVSLKYSQTWANAFLVKAQFGAFRDTTEERNAVEPTQDTGWGGSFAIRHIVPALTSRSTLVR